MRGNRSTHAEASVTVPNTREFNNILGCNDINGRIRGLQGATSVNEVVLGTTWNDFSQNNSID